jgi:hypothetical protein
MASRTTSTMRPANQAQGIIPRRCPGEYQAGPLLVVLLFESVAASGAPDARENEGTLIDGPLVAPRA